MLASVQTYGETRHVFVQRAGYDGPSCPASRRASPRRRLGRLLVGSISGRNVELGHMEEWWVLRARVRQ